MVTMTTFEFILCAVGCGVIGLVVGLFIDLIFDFAREIHQTEEIFERNEELEKHNTRLADMICEIYESRDFGVRDAKLDIDMHKYQVLSEIDAYCKDKIDEERSKELERNMHELDVIRNGGVYYEKYLNIQKKNEEKDDGELDNGAAYHYRYRGKIY